MAKNAFAQVIICGASSSCPMCSNIGWGGMTLGMLMMFAVIKALIVLAIFLARRSRSSLK